MGGDELAHSDQVKLADMGAILEHCLNAVMPFKRSADSRMMVEAIKKVGADRCVMATGFGQWLNPHPIEGMRHYIHLMMKLGIRQGEMDVMTKANPARLLDLQ